MMRTDHCERGIPALVLVGLENEGGLASQEHLAVLWPLGRNALIRLSAATRNPVALLSYTTSTRPALKNERGTGWPRLTCHRSTPCPSSVAVTASNLLSRGLSYDVSNRSTVPGLGGPTAPLGTKMSKAAVTVDISCSVIVPTTQTPLLTVMLRSNTMVVAKRSSAADSAPTVKLGGRRTRCTISELNWRVTFPFVLCS